MRARPRDLITYKNPPTRTITLGLGVQHMNLGRHGHSGHCIICWASTECVLPHLALTAALKGRNHSQFMCSKTLKNHPATEQQCQVWGWSRLFPSYCTTAFQPSVSSRQSGLHRHFPGLDTEDLILPGASDCLKQDQVRMWNGSHADPLWITQLRLWNKQARTRAYTHTYVTSCSTQAWVGT